MSFANASENADRATELFEKHVRPTLVDHCIRCHGAEKQQAGLRLDTREGWLQGGDTGPAIVAGNADSLLAEANRAVSSLADIDETVRPLLEILDSASIQISEVSDSLQRYAEGVDMDPSRRD